MSTDPEAELQRLAAAGHARSIAAKRAEDRAAAADADRVNRELHPTRLADLSEDDRAVAEQLSPGLGRAELVAKARIVAPFAVFAAFMASFGEKGATYRGQDIGQLAGWDPLRYPATWAVYITVALSVLLFVLVPVLRASAFRAALRVLVAEQTWAAGLPFTFIGYPGVLAKRGDRDLRLVIEFVERRQIEEGFVRDVWSGLGYGMTYTHDGKTAIVQGGLGASGKVLRERVHASIERVLVPMHATRPIFSVALEKVF